MLPDAQILIDEVSGLHEWRNLKEWIPAVLAAKAILLKGDEDRIEGSVCRIFFVRSFHWLAR